MNSDFSDTPRLPMRTLTYFISDLHLGAGYITDQRTHELKVVEFLRRIAPSARRLVLLGDILDYWWEYSTVVPRGFTRFFGELSRLADEGVEILWFKGNHDIWIFDYLPGEIGFKLCDGVNIMEWDGKRFLLEHGDGVGQLPLKFRILRKLFRCRTAQRLYSLLPPRLTVGFARAWSSHSRRTGGQMKAADDPAKNTLVVWADDYNLTHPDKPVDFFIFGHQHIALDRPLAAGGRIIILGDWISKFTYAVWDGTTLRLEKFLENEDEK